MEQITHFGLAEVLGVKSAMLRDKIIFHKRADLEKLGKLDITTDGIELNVDQVLFLTLSLSVDILAKIRLIKGVFGWYEVDTPSVVCFEDVLATVNKISETLQNPKPFTDINAYDRFVAKLGGE